MRKEIVYSLAALTGIPVMVNASSVTAIGTTTQYRGTTEMAVTPEGGANLVQGKKYSINFPNLWCEEDLTVTIKIGDTTVKTATVNAANSTVEFPLNQNGVVTITVKPATNKEYSFDAPIINLDYDFEGAAALLQRDLSPIALMIKEFSNNNKTPDVSCYNDLQGIVNQILKYDSLENADGKGAAYENIYKKYKLYEVSYDSNGALKEFDPVKNPVKKAIDSLAAEAKKHEVEYLKKMKDDQQARWDSLVAANKELETGDLKKAIADKVKAVGDSITAFENRTYAPLWENSNDLIDDDEAIMDALKNDPASLTKMIEDAIASSIFYKETAKPYVDSLIADFKEARDTLMDHLSAIKNEKAAELKTKAAAKLNAKGGNETKGLNDCLLNVQKAFQDGKLGDANTKLWADYNNKKGLKSLADSTFKADSALIEKFDSLGKYLVYVDSVKGAGAVDSFAIADFDPLKSEAGYKSPFLSIPFQEKKYKSALDKFPTIKSNLKKNVEAACTKLQNEVITVSGDATKIADSLTNKFFKAVIDSLKKYNDLAPLAQVTDSFASLQNYWKLKQDTLDAEQDSLGIAPAYKWRDELKALNDSAWKSWRPLSFDSIDNQVKTGGYQDTAIVKKLTLQTTVEQANNIKTGFDNLKKQIDSLFDQTKEAMEIYARVDTTIAALKDSLDEVREAVKSTEIYRNTLEIDGKMVGGYKAILDSLENGKATDPKSLAMIKKQLKNAMDARGAKGVANAAAPDSTHTELMKALSTDLFKAQGDSAKLKAKIDSLKQNWESDLKKYKEAADSAAKAALRQSVIDMCDSLHHDSIRIMKLGYPAPQIANLDSALKETYGKAVAELDTMIKMIFQDLDTLSEKAARAMAAKSNEEADFDTLGIYAAKLRELIKKMDIVKKRADRAIKEVAENKKAKAEAEEAMAAVAEQLKKARALVASKDNEFYKTAGYNNGGNGACYDVWTNGENGEQAWYRAQIGGPKLNNAEAEPVEVPVVVGPVNGPGTGGSSRAFREPAQNNANDSIITDSLADTTCDFIYHKLEAEIDSSFTEETLKKDLAGYKTRATDLIAQIIAAMEEMKNKQANWKAYKNFEPFYTLIEQLLADEEPEIRSAESEETETNKPTALKHYLEVLDGMWIDYQGNRAKDSLLEAEDANGLIADSMGVRDDIYQDYLQESLTNSDQVARRRGELSNLIDAIQAINERALANKEGYNAPLAADGLKALWNEVNDSVQAAKNYVNQEYQFADQAQVLQRVVDMETELKKIQPDTLYKYGQLEDYVAKYGDDNKTQKYIDSRDKLKALKLAVTRYIASLKENFDSLADATNQQYIDKIISKTEETREIYKKAVKTQDEFKRLTNPVLREALSDSIADRDREYNDSLATYPGKINDASSSALDAMAEFIAENPDKPYKNDKGVQHGKDTMALEKLGQQMEKMESEYAKAMKDAIDKEVTDWITAAKADINADKAWIDSLKLNPGSSVPVSAKFAELADQFYVLDSVFAAYKAGTLKVAELDKALNAVTDYREDLNEVINEAALDALSDALAKAKGIIAAAEENENFQKFLNSGEVKDIINFSRGLDKELLVKEEINSLPEWWEAQKALIESSGEEFDAEFFAQRYSDGPYNNGPRSRAAAPSSLQLLSELFSNAEDAFNAIEDIAQAIEEYQTNLPFADSRAATPVVPDINAYRAWQYGPYADLYGNFDYSMKTDSVNGELGDEDAQVNYYELYQNDKIKKQRPVDQYFNLAGVLYDFNKNNLYTKFLNDTQVYDGYKDVVAEIKEQMAEAIQAADQFVVKERIQLSEELRNDIAMLGGDRDSLNDSGALFKIRASMYQTLKNKLSELNNTGLVAEKADTTKWNEWARAFSAAMTLKKDTLTGEKEFKPTLFADELAYLQNRKSDMINLFNEIAANAANISPAKHAEAKKLEDKILVLYAELDSVAKLDSVTIGGQKVPNNPAVLLEFQTKAAALMKELTDSAEADGLYALAKARKEFADVDSMVNVIVEAYQEYIEQYQDYFTEALLTRIQNMFAEFKTAVNTVKEEVDADQNLLFYKDEYWDKIALATQTLEIQMTEMDQYVDGDLMDDCRMFQRIISRVQEAKDKAATALQSEFSTDMTSGYANRLARIQMHLDKAKALVADLKEDGEAYYAPTDETLDRKGVRAAFIPAFYYLYSEIEDILDDAAQNDLEDIADDLMEQVDGLDIDDSKLLNVEAQQFRNALWALQEDVEDFQDDVYDGDYDYDNYDEGKSTAEELQERINALKQAIGDALVEPTVRGDLNGDGVADWEDFYILANAVQTQTEPEDGDENFDLFNINGDDAVDVTDIILLRDYCISGEWTDGAEARSSWLDKKDILDVQTVSTENGVTRLAINLTNEKNYRALQLDLNLGTANLVGATLAERTAGVLRQSEIVDGIVRLFTVPNTSEEGISGNQGAVIYLDIEGAAEISGTATFATNNYKSERFDLSGTTAIDKLKNAAAAAGQKVYNLGGRMMDGLKKGVNILRGEDGSAKKVIKK